MVEIKYYCAGYLHNTGVAGPWLVHNPYNVRHRESKLNTMLLHLYGIDDILVLANATLRGYITNVCTTHCVQTVNSSIIVMTMVIVFIIFIISL